MQKYRADKYEMQSDGAKVWRGKEKFASMALSFQEARDFAAMIIAACEDSGH